MAKNQKIPYAKALETLLAIGLSEEEAKRKLQPQVENGRVSDPSSKGFSRELSAEEKEIKNAWKKLAQEHKKAFDVLKAKKVIPTLYFAGAKNLSGNQESGNQENK